MIFYKSQFMLLKYTDGVIPGLEMFQPNVSTNFYGHVEIKGEPGGLWRETWWGAN